MIFLYHTIKLKIKVDTHQTDRLSVPYQFFFQHPILDFLYCPSLNELICFAVYIKHFFKINYILFKTGIFFYNSQPSYDGKFSTTSALLFAPVHEVVVVERFDCQ